MWSLPRPVNLLQQIVQETLRNRMSPVLRDHYTIRMIAMTEDEMASPASAVYEHPAPRFRIAPQRPSVHFGRSVCLENCRDVAVPIRANVELFVTLSLSKGAR